MENQTLQSSLNKCYKCFRPFETCYCKDIVPIKTDIKFVFLMHPKEAYKQKTGTGRLAHLTLIDSEIIVGVDFTENPRLKSLIQNPAYYPVLMYPSPEAWTATGTRENPPHTLKEACEGKTLLVILVDATWACAKKMVKLSKNLHTLPKISFTAGYKSIYTFKTEPQEDFISTIETCYYLLQELRVGEFSTTLAQADFSPEPLMNIFKKMITTQLESQRRREESGEPDRYQLAGSIRAKKKALRDKKNAAPKSEN